MEDARAEKKAITLRRCQVKQLMGEYELIASSHTSVEVTPDRNFDVTAMTDDLMSVVESVADIENVQVNNRVSIQVKIVQVDGSVSVNTSDGCTVTKQECVCADGTHSCRLVLWERLIDSVEPGKSYELKKVTVRSFQEVFKYCEIIPRDDIGEIVEDIQQCEAMEIIGEVVAVVKIDIFRVCSLFVTMGVYLPFLHFWASVSNVRV